VGLVLNFLGTDRVATTTARTASAVPGVQLGGCIEREAASGNGVKDAFTLLGRQWHLGLPVGGAVCHRHPFIGA